jgi:hypothetical protein
MKVLGHLLDRLAALIGLSIFIVSVSLAWAAASWILART